MYNPQPRQTQTSSKENSFGEQVRSHCSCEFGSIQLFVSSISQLSFSQFVLACKQSQRRQELVFVKKKRQRPVKEITVNPKRRCVWAIGAPWNFLQPLLRLPSPIGEVAGAIFEFKIVFGTTWDGIGGMGRRRRKR